ncbi:MAG TPA: hypothetical protein VNS55_09205 [Nocardioides sp.]|nr:hypothetical protein [Nocardioides sp.]
MTEEQTETTGNQDVDASQNPDTSELWEADDARNRGPETALDGTPVEEIEEERRRRLAPENRPENAEVDNTDRDFDVEKGMFTDEPGYEEAPRKYPPLGEGGA